jgi:hypothetical protein
MTTLNVVFYHPHIITTGGTETMILRLLRGAGELVPGVNFRVVCAKSDIDLPGIDVIGSKFYLPGLSATYDMPVDVAVATGLSGLVAAHGCASVRAGLTPLAIMLMTTTELNWPSMRTCGRHRVADYVGSVIPPTNVIFPTAFTRAISSIRHPLLVESPLVPLPVWAAFGAAEVPEPGRVIVPPSGLRVVSVGRLERFKAYNAWMPRVIADLRSKDIDITWDVFGHGTEEPMIRTAAEASGGAVRFRGVLPYAEFASTVSTYNCFVGTGTAVWEAALTGVPCLVPEMWSSGPNLIGAVHECLEMSAGEPRTDGIRFDAGHRLAELAGLSQADRNAIGAQDREFVVQRMSPEVVLPDFIRTLRACQPTRPMSRSLLIRDANFLAKERLFGAFGVRSTYIARGDEPPEFDLQHIGQDISAANLPIG